VSDFIGRVAARAVGDRATASPRVGSLFEAPGAAAGAGLEVIDEEIAANASDPSAPDSSPAGEPVEPRAPSAAVRAVPAEAGATRVEAEVASPSVPSAEPPQSHARDLNERSPDRVAATRGETPPRTRHADHAPPHGVAAVLAPAAPIVARTPAHALPAPSAARAELPTVRVHIGRLEVRADVQEQPLRAERAPAPRPQELSLSDYLRGRRERR
jgi:hypothetical protein